MLHTTHIRIVWVYTLTCAMPLLVGYFLSILSFASPFRKCHKRSLVEETAELGVFFTSTNAESFSLFNVS